MLMICLFILFSLSLCRYHFYFQNVKHSTYDPVQTLRNFAHILLFKQIVIFIFFFTFQNIVLKAQPVNNLVKDVTMPAPNAAALGKYGDYSVGNFTGVPDISIDRKSTRLNSSHRP